MRIAYALLVMCLACKSSSSPTESPRANASAPANSTASAPKAEPPAASAPSGACCCVSSDSADGDVFAENCAAKPGGKCVTPWTQQCSDDYEQQRVAEERNAANAGCPSGDRHDCDGNGIRDDEEKHDKKRKAH